MWHGPHDCEWKSMMTGRPVKDAFFIMASNSALVFTSLAPPPAAATATSTESTTTRHRDKPIAI
jgi:hypothetical protein